MSSRNLYMKGNIIKIITLCFCIRTASGELQAFMEVLKNTSTGLNTVRTAGVNFLTQDFFDFAWRDMDRRSDNAKRQFSQNLIEAHKKRISDERKARMEERDEEIKNLEAENLLRQKARRDYAEEAWNKWDAAWKKHDNFVRDFKKRMEILEDIKADVEDRTVLLRESLQNEDDADADWAAASIWERTKNKVNDIVEQYVFDLDDNKFPRYNSGAFFGQTNNREWWDQYRYESMKTNYKLAVKQDLGPTETYTHVLNGMDNDFNTLIRDFDNAGQAYGWGEAYPSEAMFDTLVKDDLERLIQKAKVTYAEIQGWYVTNAENARPGAYQDSNSGTLHQVKGDWELDLRDELRDVAVKYEEYDTWMRSRLSNFEAQLERARSKTETFRSDMNLVVEKLDIFEENLNDAVEYVKTNLYSEKQEAHDRAVNAPHQYMKMLFGDMPEEFHKYLRDEQDEIIAAYEKANEEPPYPTMWDDSATWDSYLEWEEWMQDPWWEDWRLVHKYQRQYDAEREAELEAMTPMENSDNANVDPLDIPIISGGEAEISGSVDLAGEQAAKELESTPPMENSDNANGEDPLDIPMISGGEAEIDEGVGLSDLFNIFSEDWWSDDGLTGTGKMGMVTIAIFTTLMTALMFFLGCGRQATPSQMNGNYYDQYDYDNGYYDDDFQHGSYYHDRRRMLDTPFTKLAGQIGVDLEKNPFVHDSGASEVSPGNLLDIIYVPVLAAVAVTVCVVVLHKIYKDRQREL